MIEMQIVETQPSHVTDKSLGCMYAMTAIEPQVSAKLTVDNSLSSPDESPFDEIIHWRPLTSCPQGFWKKKRA
jgi:hypothetical protein